jgi:hypothetical protein
MAELAQWFPDDATFQPAVNKDPHAKEYLRRSWERGTAGSTHISPRDAPAPSVVQRLYASYDKVRR